MTKPIPARDLIAAAKVLEEHAEVLWTSYQCAGEWTRGTSAVRREHDRCRNLAKKFRRAAA